ncbi:MAG TPA: heme-binding domain-containing protein [Leptospiraceae bacterium]|nr:heme-binding domain-containing protein [Leptospiraceae bacterium]
MKKKILIAVPVIFLLLQLIPINRKNPEVKADLIAEEKVKSVLKKSCYDCHSNETVYPSYSYIFPASVFLAHHVEEGREELNFSEWENYTAKKKSRKAEEIIKELDKNDMPLFSYTLIHRDAVLSSEEKKQLKSWAKGFSGEPEEKEEK